MSNISCLPVDYVQISIFESITGYSHDAVQKKIKRGEWREGEVWRRAPDGHVLVSLKGYHSWVEDQPAG